MFAGAEEELPATGEHRQPERNRRTSLIVLLFITAGVAWMSRLLVGSVEHAGQALGLNHVFIGVFVVAIKNKMDLTVHIAVGSGIQIALFVSPALVFASMLLGHPQSLDLHFTPLEIMAVIFAVGVLALVAQDGETHWMEGIMLLGVYVILALAFYHLPGGGL